MLEWNDIGFLGWTSKEVEGHMAFYVNNQLECAELHLGMDEELTENLRVRIKERAEVGNIM